LKADSSDRELCAVILILPQSG